MLIMFATVHSPSHSLGIMWTTFQDRIITVKPVSNAELNFAIFLKKFYFTGILSEHFWPFLLKRYSSCIGLYYFQDVKLANSADPRN